MQDEHLWLKSIDIFIFFRKLQIVLLYKTLIHLAVEPFEAALKPSMHWLSLKSTIWRKSWNVFLKNLHFFSTEERKT